MAKDRCRCTAEERTVLDMIRCWPGIPAIVSYEQGQWSVSTSDRDIQEWLASNASRDLSPPSTRGRPGSQTPPFWRQ